MTLDAGDSGNSGRSEEEAPQRPARLYRVRAAKRDAFLDLLFDAAALNLSNYKLNEQGVIQVKLPATSPEDVVLLQDSVGNAILWDSGGALLLESPMRLSGFFSAYVSAQDPAFLARARLPNFKEQIVEETTIPVLKLRDYRLFDWDGVRGPLKNQSLQYVFNAIEAAGESEDSSQAYRDYSDYLDRTFADVAKRFEGERSRSSEMVEALCAYNGARVVCGLMKTDALDSKQKEVVSAAFFRLLQDYCECVLGKERVVLRPEHCQHAKRFLAKLANNKRRRESKQRTAKKPRSE